MTRRWQKPKKEESASGKFFCGGVCALLEIGEFEVLEGEVARLPLALLAHQPAPRYADRYDRYAGRVPAGYGGLR